MGWGGIGGIVNSITGASNSARQQNQYAVGMANLNFNQQKEMLLNGPSWQMEGYANAGVNPMFGLSNGLSTGGAGGNSAPGGGAGGQLAGLSAIAEMYNDTRATSANNNSLDAQAELARAQAQSIIMNLDVDHKTKIQMLKNLGLTAEQIKEKTQNIYEDTNLKGWQKDKAAEEIKDLKKKRNLGEFSAKYIPGDWS